MGLDELGSRINLFGSVKKEDRLNYIVALISLDDEMEPGAESLAAILIKDHGTRIDNMSDEEFLARMQRYEELQDRTTPSGMPIHPLLISPQARVDLFFCNVLPRWTKMPVIGCSRGVYTCQELDDADLARLEALDKALFDRSGGWYNSTLITPEEKSEQDRILSKCRSVYPVEKEM